MTVAGRTDAGVHARGQVAHVDVPCRPCDREDAGPRLAGVLPSDVRVFTATVAPPGFDARFSALSRRYAYRVSDARYWRRPAASPRGPRSSAAARRGRHGRRRGTAARRARLRGVLPATSRRHDRADAAALLWQREPKAVSRSRRSRPTRSATAWCDRWSARSSRSVRAGARSTGRRRCWTRASAIPRPGRRRPRADSRRGLLPAAPRR